MTLMLSPVPGRIYVVSSGAVYNSDQTTGIIVNVVTVQDVSDLIAAGCAVVNPPPTDLLFSLKAANFNVATDQLLVPNFSGRFRPKRFVVMNASISLTTAAGGFYTAGAKGGTALVAAGQAYSALNAAADWWAAGTPVYLSLTTAQGAAATADVYVYGDVYA
ncbi:MAG TPA: hypothetical protein VNX86_01035 [Rhizomicrobium sp.]|jgi:hypothetical protein|nr:hypothetical protein [Rhizomicrobium sp.]